MTSSSNSSQSTRPTVCRDGLDYEGGIEKSVLGENYWSFLDFTCKYEGTSGIFVP